LAVPFVAVLFKDGESFAACEFAKPMDGNSLRRLPATIELPAWVDEVTL